MFRCGSTTLSCCPSLRTPPTSRPRGMHVRECVHMYKMLQGHLPATDGICIYILRFPTIVCAYTIVFFVYLYAHISMHGLCIDWVTTHTYTRTLIRTQTHVLFLLLSLSYTRTPTHSHSLHYSHSRYYFLYRHLCVYVRMYMFQCVYVHGYICTCLYICIYIYIYIHT